VAKIKAMIALVSSGFTMKGMKDMKKSEACEIVLEPGPRAGCGRPSYEPQSAARFESS
jgi:hypothetical protein